MGNLGALASRSSKCFEFLSALRNVVNFLCRCRNTENVEPTFMLALCSRVVVLLGSPVSLKDCKKDELYDCLGGGGNYC